jgi:Mal s 1 allergenic protein-like
MQTGRFMLHRHKLLHSLFLALLMVGPAIAQDLNSALPRKGMAGHDFLMTGEWDYRKPVQTIFLVRGGKLIWTYEIPFKESSGETAELGDANMRPNGNIVFSTKTEAYEVSPEKKIIWNYAAPAGTEIHSIEPIGNDKTLMVINGAPAILKLINIKTGVTENEFALPTGKPSPHLQFRRVRMTPGGTFIAAHLDSDMVAEYDTKGSMIWSVRVPKPWSALRLKNGNTLITATGNGSVIEVDKKGETVWALSQPNLPELKLYQMQVAVRLENGNTVISNWCVNGIKDPKDWPGSVQYFEITPDKKLVWTLNQWTNPDLGPGSSIQVLDEPSFKMGYGYLERY